MELFTSALSQMLVLFLFIAIGFVLQKTKIVPESGAGVISKLENNLFVPAVVLSTFMQNCTVGYIKTSWKLILFGLIVAAVTIALGLIIAKFTSKDDFIRKTYAYGLCFANFSFMGIALLKALYPQFLTDYLLFTLPAQVALYGWMIPYLLIPKENSAESGEAVLTKKEKFKKKIKPFVNPMFIAVLAGIIIGVSGLGAILPEFITETVKQAGNCMSPLAMLLTGIVVAKYDLKPVLKMPSLYIVTALRLIILPFLLGFILKLTPLRTGVYMLVMICYVSMPLGLNTVVIPTAYGKDTSLAAGMALVSNVLSVLTIPLVFMVFL